MDEMFKNRHGSKVYFQIRTNEEDKKRDAYSKVG